MAPQGDWPESRERVQSELARNAAGIHEVRNVVNTMQLSNQAALNEQTKALTATINANHNDTTAKISDLRVEITTLKTKFAMWFLIASFFGTIAASVIAAIVVRLVVNR